MGSVGQDGPGYKPESAWGANTALAKQYQWHQCPLCLYEHRDVDTCDANWHQTEHDASSQALKHASFTDCSACGKRHKNASVDMMSCAEFAARCNNVERLVGFAMRAKEQLAEAAFSGERHYQSVDRLEAAIGFSMRQAQKYDPCPHCAGAGKALNQFTKTVTSCDACYGTGKRVN